jgi:radical SAM superfamily enzyme YgiQ (UPF0313 family)
MEQLKIYLGDLTYDTTSISTDSFPLNIGYIASYCIKKFGTKIDIKLFKYINELEDAILESPPDILGLSNYAWNHRIGLEMFRILHKKNPNSLKIFGGPNFPTDVESQEKFMLKNDEIDIYVPIEGEVGFSNIVEKALNSFSKNELRHTVLSELIDGCIMRNTNHKLVFTESIRLKTLDEIPSPYLTGLLDSFFDGKLTPMLQTNRGCPFQCSYCVDGTDDVRTVNRFTSERITQEIEYIAQHVPEITNSLIIADLNFGMMPNDTKTCDVISQVQEKYNYPKQISASTGKNSKDKIVDAIGRVNGALRLWLSVQSTEPVVLENVHRENISIDQMLALQPTIKKYKLPTVSEIIIGLPGDTYESCIQTFRDLIRAQVDECSAYTLMLIDGSELNTPTERKKWGFKTKFRILPRDFVKLRNEKKIIEIEEVVIASNTLSFDDYLKIRLLAFSYFQTNQLGYAPILKFLKENQIELFELFHRPTKNLKNLPKNIQLIFEKFGQSTKDELWDSPESIEKYFQDNKNFEKLLTEELGINVIQFYQAFVTKYFINDWTEFIIFMGQQLLSEKSNLDKSIHTQFSEISNYCRGLTNNLLELDKNLKPLRFDFNYDIKKWLEDPEQHRLQFFRLSNTHSITFEYDVDTQNVFKNKINIYGNSIVGLAQTIKRIAKPNLWRREIIYRN